MNGKDRKTCNVRDIGKIDTDDFEEMSEVLGAIANKARIAIIESVLKYGEVCTCELESATDMAQPTVTAHLRKLYRAGVLKKREEWKYTYYSLNDAYRPLVLRILELKTETESTKERA